MKILLGILFIISAVSCEFCYKTARIACNSEDATSLNCTAKYGLAHRYISDLQLYTNIHIARSFQYLLMSSHFGNYQKNREGFKKLYRKLSDTAWNDAIDMIKYITLRGGSMDFHYDDDELEEGAGPVVEMSELESLALSLDIQKKIAHRAHKIYKEAHKHDPEVSSYLEEKFLHKHAKTIRELAGHTNDLAKLIRGEKPPSVGTNVFIFDSYLEKTV